MSGVKRLTPIVPGEMQPVVFIDDTITTGYFGGAATEGRGFPQWAMDIFGNPGRAHYFLEPDGDGVATAECARTQKSVTYLYLPGNFPRCKECVRIRKLREKYR